MYEVLSGRDITGFPAAPIKALKGLKIKSRA